MLLLAMRTSAVPFNLACSKTFGHFILQVWAWLKINCKIGPLKAHEKAFSYNLKFVKLHNATRDYV